MENSHPMLSRYVIPDMPSADELLPYLRQIDEGRWYSNFGPLATRFENRIARRLTVSGDAKAPPISVTATASCYHALEIGLRIFDLPKDAHVLVPAVTFPACPHAVRHAGAEPVFADIDPTTWQLTPDIARHVASKMPIHAVMPVAIYGVPVPVDAWDRFMSETGIPVIIDAAAALEAQPVPDKALVAFSLHATKPFSIGEGGLLASRDRRVIDEARMISNFGTQQRLTLTDGMNAKISEYHGAVALAQLDRWHGIKERRRKVFSLYQRMADDMGIDVTFQHDIEFAIVSTLMLQTTRAEGATIVAQLNARGIAAHRMYLPPLYAHPHFGDRMVVNADGRTLPRAASLEDKESVMTGSETMQRNTFGLPFHTFLDEGDIAHVMKVLSAIIGMPRTRALRA